MLFASSWHDLNISDGAQAGFSPRGAAARPRPPVGAVLPSCRCAGAGLEPGIPAHAWDVQFPLGDISSSCSGYTCGGCLSKWGDKSGGAQSVAATSVWVCFYFLAGQWQRMDPGPDSSHETGPITQNVGHTSAWPLLLLLLHLTLCMNPIFQYMNSVFQCKNPLVWGFMNPLLWYLNLPVSVGGFCLHTCFWEI